MGRHHGKYEKWHTDEHGKVFKERSTLIMILNIRCLSQQGIVLLNEYSLKENILVSSIFSHWKFI